MELYRELLNILTQYKRNQFQILGLENGTKANQYDRLYDFMIANPEATFEDCLSLLFPVGKRKQFTNFLGKFKGRLINALFLIDIKKTNYGVRNEGYYLGWKNLAAIKILLRLGAKTAAEDLLKQTLKIALPTENFSVLAELYRVQSDIAAHRAAPEEVEGYFNEFLKYNELYVQFSRAKFLYAGIQSQLFNRKSLPKELAEVTARAKKQMESMVADHDFDLIWMMYYFIVYNYYSSRNMKQEIVTLMREAIARLKDSKAVTTGSIGTFYHIQMVSQAALGRYDEVIELSERSEVYMIGSSSLNYFVGKEFLCLVLLYKGDYQVALEEYYKLRKNPSFKKLSPYKRENWIIIEAFLQLLNLVGYIETTDHLKLPRFSPAKFANEVIHNQKDKQGFNVTYQILQVLFMLQTQKLDRAEDKIMSLYKYAQRHLRDDPETERSFLFISALVQIPRGGFDYREVESRAKVWLDKMNAISPLQTASPFEVEIIHYSKMWDLGMLLLSKKGILAN
ncbi:hypothetical protein CEQ90_12035 [Lewinellaceae bacterium SD302]|nr:hypothetical protein CEQ90_12035 [Lewinellaceae bacterium SD302]